MSQVDFGPYIECSLRVAIDLVNSVDPVSGEDSIQTPEALGRFLAEHEVSDVAPPTAQDLEAVAEIRSRLREAFEVSDHDRAVEILNEMLETSGARPVLTNHDGTWHMHHSPEGSPLGQRIAAEASMALSVVIAKDGFDRLRRCAGDNCEDVFVDESRNRSRRYCSPQVCGNRASVAAFRARQRDAQTG